MKTNYNALSEQQILKVVEKLYKKLYGAAAVKLTEGAVEFEVQIVLKTNIIIYSHLPRELLCRGSFSETAVNDIVLFITNETIGYR